MSNNILWTRIRELEQQLRDAKEDMLQNMLRMQLQERRHYGYTHIAQYTPKSVFNFVELGGDHVFLHDFRIRLDSRRYQVFKQSCACDTCGIEGTIFCIDTQGLQQSKGHATSTCTV